MRKKFKTQMQNVFGTVTLSVISISIFCQTTEPLLINKPTKAYQKLEDFVWSFSKASRVENKNKLIDFNVLDHWQQMGDYLATSADGMYFAYTVESGTDLNDTHKKIDSLIIQSTTKSWRKVFTNVNPGFFSNNNKQYIFKQENTLHFLPLNGKKTSDINDVVTYDVSENENAEWLAYQVRKNNCVVIKNLSTAKQKSFYGISAYSFDPSHKWLECIRDSNGFNNSELILYQLASGAEKHFSRVAGFTFSAEGNSVLLKTIDQIDGEIQSLQYVNLSNGDLKTIWTSKNKNISLCEYKLDAAGKQAVFVICDSTNLKNSNSIWYYNEQMDKAVRKVGFETNGINPKLRISNTVSFTDNDRYIKFELQPETILRKSDILNPQLEIWNFKDGILHSSQPYLANQIKNFVAVIDVINWHVIQLENEQTSLYLMHGNFALLKKNNKTSIGDRFWQAKVGENQDSNWVVSLINGNITPLPTNGGVNTLWISPSGNYLTYFHPESGHYFSYNLLSNALVDLTPKISKKQFFQDNWMLRTSESTEIPSGIAAWLPDDEGILVYDNNDIWKLNFDTSNVPINITNGYGCKNHIIFSLFDGERLKMTAPSTTTKERTILVRAFNTKNKYCGYYMINTNGDANPKSLYMGKYFTEMIEWCQDPNLSNRGKHPLLAKNAKKWIVQRQSEKESPNYFLTSDFTSFKRLTNLQPQNGHNWLSEELHEFKFLDNTTGQGILYKPENFDSTRKYPVLVILYGHYSNNLYQFPFPSYNSTAISPGVSPVWFLNNGYLVFVPDIYVAPLRYGPEAYNVIEGAANYLKKLTFVDSSRLACVSHSWSAKLGAYIFTHSKSFAATAITEGFLYSNLIKSALSTDENGLSKLEAVENDFKYGNLWSNKALWLDQTTILNIDRSNSPILLLCNKGSNKDYQEQTTELFIALRRLEKKAWWLQYEKGSHTLTYLSDRKDYTIRYTQYFDHFLKDAPAPVWMTHGIRNEKVTPETGYDLDPSGACSDDCDICKRWNKKFRLEPKMFSKPISEWHLDD